MYICMYTYIHMYVCIYRAAVTDRFQLICFAYLKKKNTGRAAVTAHRRCRPLSQVRVCLCVCLCVSVCVSVVSEYTFRVYCLGSRV